MLTVLLLLGLCWADPTPEPKPEVEYERVTVIDFEGVDLEAELVKPVGMLLMDVKGITFNPLLPLRTDFDKEMLESITEVK